MTNRNALETLEILNYVEKIYFEKDTKVLVPLKVFYAVQKNVRKFNVVKKEKEDIDKDIMTSFKKEYDFDDKNQDDNYIKEADLSYKEFVKKSDVIDTYAEFFEKEAVIEHYKIDKEILSEAVLPTFVLEKLEELC